MREQPRRLPFLTLTMSNQLQARRRDTPPRRLMPADGRSRQRIKSSPQLRREQAVSQPQRQMPPKGRIKLCCRQALHQRQMQVPERMRRNRVPLLLRNHRSPAIPELPHSPEPPLNPEPPVKSLELPGRRELPNNLGLLEQAEQALPFWNRRVMQSSTVHRSEKLVYQCRLYRLS